MYHRFFVGLLAVLATTNVTAQTIRIERVTFPAGTVLIADTATTLPLTVDIKNDSTGGMQFYLQAEIDGIADSPRTAMMVLAAGERRAIPFSLSFTPRLSARQTTLAIGVRLLHPAGRELAHGAVSVPIRPRLTPGSTATATAMPLVPTYDVEVTLQDLRIHDDCDSVTDGDWIVHFGAVEYRDAEFRTRANTRYPNRGSANVDSGTREAINKTLTLSRVDERSEIWLTIAAVDCDQDSPFTWTFTAPTAWISAASGGGDTSFATFASSCGGEEFTEVSGANDRVGELMFRLSSERWRRGGDVAATDGEFRRAECGDRPYTPTIRVRTTRR